MRDLSELMKDDDIIRCACGSSAFFDWGIELLNKAEKFASTRFNEVIGSDRVRICINCQKPVVLHSGDLYDASEYVSPEEVDRLIRWSQERQSRTPVKTMDP